MADNLEEKVPDGKMPQEQGVCPVCGCTDLVYGPSRPDGQTVCYGWVCRGCGAGGQEVHSLEFSGHRVTFKPSGGEGIKNGGQDEL